LSPRAGKEFVVINCAAIPEALLESELFGYVRGAFTGAVQSRIGRIHSAHGGTLFLDEIGELPLGMQAKLLRFLDQGEVQRLGSSDVFRVDVRVLAATNANLSERAARKLFREDLFYRLSVFPIEMPPLSQRRTDIEPLARHFLQRFDPENANATLSPQAVRLLEKHLWPGNVRELQHVIERASILAEGGPILPEHLGLPGSEMAQLAAAGGHLA
jgi:transcriptional regulator with GAF, ATPase, and Fis domain